jgi:hypothetical protein
VILKDLDYDIVKLVAREVTPFKGFTCNHIIQNYQCGVSDMVLRFRRGEIAILSNGELMDNKQIVSVRCRLLANVLAELYQTYQEEMDQLDLVIPVCLSDTNETHLQDIPCLVFSKTSFSNNIVIPSVNNLAGQWELDHVHAWDKPLYMKSDTLCFVGSLTGRQDSPESLKGNSRLQIAAKASANPYYFCKIMRPPQVTEEDFAGLINRCREVYPDLQDNIFMNQEDKIHLNQQLDFKYQICVDGHTCAWARLPWQMGANCVPIKIRNRRHAWREWYYPLLDSSKHFLEVDVDELDDAYMFLINNPQIQDDINEEGKSFVKTYIDRELAMRVFLQTLLLLNETQDNTFLVRSEEAAQLQANPPQELP